MQRTVSKPQRGFPHVHEPQRGLQEYTGPNGAFRYVSCPPQGGFSKPRPMAVVGYLSHSRDTEGAGSRDRSTSDMLVP
jgi:hypothetical protein